MPSEQIAKDDAFAIVQNAFERVLIISKQDVRDGANTRDQLAFCLRHALGGTPNCRRNAVAKFAGLA
jgi:hypothetical protein